MTGIIVAGMHRSGTSLMTRYLAAGGWHPGDDLLIGRRESYEEDARFVDLNRSFIEATLPPGDGHRDWGVSDGGSIDLDLVEVAQYSDMRGAAQAFADRRDVDHPRWVAKDPRSTLMLPVWAEVADLGVVVVYRNPWDVVDSAIRIGEPEWTKRPRLVLAAWLDYCRRILDLVTAHRDRCVLIAGETLVADPVQVWRLLDDVFGMSSACPTDLTDGGRFVVRGDDTPLAALYREVHPDHVAVLDELDRLADIARTVSVDRRRVVERQRQCPRRASPGGTVPADTGVQVLVPCRDDGDFLLEAIASVDAQVTAGRDDVELTIVDDGSTDPETLRILGALRATGRQIITTPGLGLSAARNVALSVSRSLAVIPLDADNRLRSPLVEALGYVERGEADVVHGPWRRFGLEDTVVEPPEMTIAALVPNNTIDACALIRRDALERLGGWDASLPFWEDWDLWLGVVGAGLTVRRLDEVTFDYLVRPDSLSSAAITDPKARRRVVDHVVAKHSTVLGRRFVRSTRRAHRHLR